MPRLAAFEAPTTRTTLETLARLAARMLRGKLNVTGTLTLEAGSTETVIRDAEFGSSTVLVLVATTVGGQELTYRQHAVGKGEITIRHDAPLVDAPFLYIALG